PEWEIGLELNLTCKTTGCRWGPVAGPLAVPGLVEPTGTFPMFVAPGAKREEILAEFTAQLERARAWGISPSFLEFDAEAGLEIEGLMRSFSEQVGLPAQLTSWGVSPLALPDALEQAEGMLQGLAPGVYLWSTRPAQCSPETWALWGETVAERCQRDYEYLCNPQLRQILDRLGIELISFRQHVEARLGNVAEAD